MACSGRIKRAQIVGHPTETAVTVSSMNAIMKRHAAQRNTFAIGWRPAFGPSTAADRMTRMAMQRMLPRRIGRIRSKERSPKRLRIITAAAAMPTSPVA
jgi:hypothetical protein